MECPQPCLQLASSSAATAAAGFGSGAACFRCLHTSPHASAASAAVAAAAVAPAASAAPAPPPRPQSRRQPPVSPHAYEFQRRFFQLINNTAASQVSGGPASSTAASEALASSSNSQAVRMLLAWLEEGRATAAAEQQQQSGSGATSTSAPPPPPGAVAAPYRLEQHVIDRAMEVLWRLYYQEDLLVRRYSYGRRGDDASATAAAGGGDGGAEGPMGLRELLTAAEALAAAAPAMGLTFKRQHYDLLMELYGKRALLNPGFRRGLAQRMLDVRQQMVQQLLPLSQVSLNYILTAVRQDPDLRPAEKLSTALRLIERDLPVASAAAPAASSFSSSAAPPDALARMLQQTLCFLMRDAARESDWAAYQKLEAVLVSRTRAVPPYEVLLEVLSSACAGGQAQRALGALEQMELLEAQQPRPTGASERSRQQYRGAEQQQQQVRQQQQHQELWALRTMLRLGAEQKNEQLAEKSYDRLRKVLWRDHAEALTAAAAATDGAAAAGVGASSRRGVATAAEAAVVRPAPAEATLALLSLALERRDWVRVMDLVVALAELHSLERRSNGRVGKLLGEPMLERSASAYGGLGPLSAALVASEADTVAYYTELLRRVGAAAASGTAASPFGGSHVPFGPPLRAAAFRRDLASVAGIVKQMRELQCQPGSDSYAAVIDASLRAGKPERLAGLMDLMAEERLYPSAAVWEVQLTAATEAADGVALAAVAESALRGSELGKLNWRGVAAISREVLAAAAAATESLGDSRATSVIKLLRMRAGELEQRLQRARQQQQQEQQKQQQQQQFRSA